MIKKRRIQNLKKYIRHIKRGESLYVGYRVAGEAAPALKRVGFSPDCVSGATILPVPKGPTTTFNADGKWLVHRDKPKESRFVRTIMWSWTEWHGRDRVEKSEERDIFQECYPRDWLPAPGIELTYWGEEPCWIVSPKFENDAKCGDLLLHTINMFLELFGECELLNEAKVPLVGRNVHRVNWRLLPPGDNPWRRYRLDLKEELEKAESVEAASIILGRLDTLVSYGPDDIFVGDGGFDDYLAYVFKVRGLVVLESMRRDNALYVFGLDWEKVSGLTKAQIIAGGLSKARIVHSTGWRARLHDLWRASRPMEPAK